MGMASQTLMVSPWGFDPRQIAVPTHIVARSRDYCCAGFMTFFGLTMGISVMLFAFGPAVFFLYIDRWRRLHPENRTSDE